MISIVALLPAVVARGYRRPPKKKGLTGDCIYYSDILEGEKEFII
jgi:hypothetical protein